MQSDNISTFSVPLESHTQGYAVVASNHAPLRSLLPTHRLPVIAKTPMMVVLGVYMAGGSFTQPRVLATMGITAALWATLYACNEATDLMNEQRLVVSRKTRLGLLALCGGLCAGATLLSPILGGLCLLMTLGQLAYCMPPVRLKRHWWAVLLLSGMLNPILRLECGAVWGTHAISALAYFVFVSLHLGASIRSRVLLRERDRKLTYRIAPPRTEWAGMACTGMGLLGAYGLCWQGVLPRVFLLFVSVATAFSIYAWSRRVTSVSRLRQGWLWFAVLALIAFVLLCFNK